MQHSSSVAAGAVAVQEDDTGSMTPRPATHTHRGINTLCQQKNKNNNSQVTHRSSGEIFATTLTASSMGSGMSKISSTAGFLGAGGGWGAAGAGARAVVLLLPLLLPPGPEGTPLLLPGPAVPGGLLLLLTPLLGAPLLLLPPNRGLVGAGPV